jgi:hypothetical protein
MLWQAEELGKNARLVNRIVLNTKREIIGIYLDKLGRPVHPNFFSDEAMNLIKDNMSRIYTEVDPNQ